MRAVTATSSTNIWTRTLPPRPIAGRSRNRSRRERSRRGQQRSEDRTRSRRDSSREDSDQDEQRLSSPRPRTGSSKKRQWRDRSREPSDRERALRSFHASPAETREAREDRKREQDSEDSLNSSPRRACSDEGGEPTENGAEQVAGVRCNERLLAPLLSKETRKQKSQRAPDERPVVPPPLSLDQVEREERKPYGKQHKGHPEAPSSSPALQKRGRKKKGEPQDA